MSFAQGTRWAPLSDGGVAVLDADGVMLAKVDSDGAVRVIGGSGEMVIEETAAGTTRAARYASGVLKTQIQFLASEIRMLSGVVMMIRVTEDGRLELRNLPTSDPGVEDQVWNDSGTLKVSAG